MAGRFDMGSKRVLGLPMDMALTSLVGLLALGAVIAGNIYIDAEVRANPDLNRPAATEGEEYVYEEQRLLSLQGWTDEGATSDQTLGTLPENVTVVRAVLTWTDDIGSNDVLGLAVTLNGTEVVSAEGSSGSIELNFAANGTDTDPGGGLLTGQLGAAITAVDCPGRLGPLPRDLDHGNDWTIEVYITVRTGA